jgi:hypothetical protein
MDHQEARKNWLNTAWKYAKAVNGLDQRFKPAKSVDVL